MCKNKILKNTLLLPWVQLFRVYIKLVTFCESALFFCVGFLVSIRPDSYGRSKILFFCFANAYPSQASYRPARKFYTLPFCLVCSCSDVEIEAGIRVMFSFSAFLKISAYSPYIKVYQSF